jgi:hypothetical protein
MRTNDTYFRVVRYGVCVCEFATVFRGWDSRGCTPEQPTICLVLTIVEVEVVLSNIQHLVQVNKITRQEKDEGERGSENVLGRLRVCEHPR